jgi:uncharacterized protein YjlB
MKFCAYQADRRNYVSCIRFCLWPFKSCFEVKNWSAGTSTGFGDEENPGRVEASVLKGDVIIVPAGVGHRLLEELSGGDFEMVGSYPNGKNWDMCYGKKGEEAR